MTSTEINLRVAELCGWSQIRNTNELALWGFYRGYPPKNAVIGQLEPIPNFCASLDAMFAAEETLTERQREVYAVLLDGAQTPPAADRYLGYIELPPSETFSCLIHVPAARRAEAFILAKESAENEAPRPDSSKDFTPVVRQASYRSSFTVPK